MRNLLLTILTAAAIAFSASAAENKDTKATATWIDGISVSAVGAYATEDWASGKSSIGAGVDIGLPINKFVSLHVRNLAFEGSDQWGGSVVDETSVYARAEFRPTSNDKFYLFGTGGAARYWTDDDWGFGIGLGVEYRFTKNVSVAVSRELWAAFNGDERHLNIASLRFTF